MKSPCDNSHRDSFSVKALRLLGYLGCCVPLLGQLSHFRSECTSSQTNCPNPIYFLASRSLSVVTVASGHGVGNSGMEFPTVPD